MRWRRRPGGPTIPDSLPTSPVLSVRLYSRLQKHLLPSSGACLCRDSVVLPDLLPCASHQQVGAIFLPPAASDRICPLSFHFQNIDFSSDASSPDLSVPGDIFGFSAFPVPLVGCEERAEISMCMFLPELGLPRSPPAISQPGLCPRWGGPPPQVAYR